MVRATFFAIGMFVGVWGGALLNIEEVVLTYQDDAREQPGFRGMLALPYAKAQRRIETPDWAPFTFLSFGAVTMLYSVMLKRDWGGGE